MATGGQDGKVVVWDVTIPPEQNQTASSETGVGSDGGESADESHTEDDTDDGTEHSRRSGTVGAESATGRDATESLSSASGLSDDVGSAGRASSDLGLDGSQKEQSFSQLEVSLRDALCRDVLYVVRVRRGAKFEVFMSHHSFSGSRRLPSGCSFVSCRKAC